MKLIDKKKKAYQVHQELLRYLRKFDRTLKVTFEYDELLRFKKAVVLDDPDGNDTLW